MRKITSGSSSGHARSPMTRKRRVLIHRAANAANLHRRCWNSIPTAIFLRSWGGPGQGYDWFENEHGINIDYKGFVWVGGNGNNDGQVLKFTQDGKFVLQIGKLGPQTGSADTTRLGRPGRH